ncbi:hypothetical protein BLNAU_9919 [Blattamonas nauphoetae]|uniref:Uncharacterized protein n=1 Tax=Blattamonas nauphoetae TaxID=2049346 RepID=A0ABQ9XUP1_9EUKA|nr:hypothetical protein BLNAU_9919 [Blattamonas nauphoetae]
MEMLASLILWCSAKLRLALVKADLIPHLIVTLHPLSLSFADAVDIHINVMKIIWNSLWLATPFGLNELEVKDGHEQQAVRETVFKQVLVPSETYICHLCANRFSIVDGKQSFRFLALLARLLEICPNYQPTMNFILHMPVVLTTPSCLTFFENDRSIFWFLDGMVDIQRKWNETMGEVRQTSKEVHRMLRMEGMDDAIEEKLRTEKKESFGRQIVGDSIELNNMLGMNLSEQE